MGRETEPYSETLDRVRAQIRTYIPADVSLVDELIRDRREEAAREEAEGVGTAAS